MLHTLRILIVLSTILLVLSLFGTLAFIILGHLKYAIICGISAIILFAIVLTITCVNLLVSRKKVQY